MKITGAIKTINVPDDMTLTTVRDLVLQLSQLLAVEFDVSKLTNVVVSNDEPSQADKDVIWFKVDNSGNFAGVYVYVQSAWTQMFPCPQSLYKVYGDSRQLPAGYALVSNTLSGFTAAMVAKLQEEWLLIPGTTDAYSIFHVVYVGV